MPVLYRARRSKRSRRRATRNRFLAGAALFVISFGLASILFIDSRRAGDGAAADQAVTSAPAPPAHTEADAGRPVFPYSVIEGGALSVEELKKAIDADPVVKAHFQNFDLEKTSVVELKAPRVAHVSYRIGNEVFWTRKPVVLKAGERVLTDGHHVARTRCGNQIDKTIPGAVSPHEPPPTVLDTPIRRISTRAMPPSTDQAIRQLVSVTSKAQIG